MKLRRSDSVIEPTEYVQEVGIDNLDARIHILDTRTCLLQCTTKKPRGIREDFGKLIAGNFLVLHSGCVTGKEAGRSYNVTGYFV